MKKIISTSFLVFSFFLIPLYSNNSKTELSEIPQWLAESETYGFNVDWNEIEGTAWKFITHTPHSEEFLRETRKRGIRAFPYVSFYKAYLDSRFMGFRITEHPDWALIDKNGQWKKYMFWDTEDGKNRYCTCTNVKEYADAVVNYVEKLMKRGAAGIFLDNVHPEKECYGEKYGKHKHMFKTQVESLAYLLKRTKEVIRKYDPEGALLINSADPATLPEEFWKYADADMCESYIATWVSHKRWGDWHKDWNGIDKKIPEGKQVCCLSYVGQTNNPIKDDIFFTYASSRLMNFIWSAGNSEKVRSNKYTRKLYSITLGRPTTVEKTVNEVHYRMFQNGIVAVNPTENERLIRINDDFRVSHLRDLYEETDIEVENGSVSLSIPPEGGRVWIYKPSMEPEIFSGEHKLIVKTDPKLGQTKFEIDGVSAETFAGRWSAVYEKKDQSGKWTTKYIKKDNFGIFILTFDKPGYHTLEIKDLERKTLLVPTSYKDGYIVFGFEQPFAGAKENKKKIDLSKYANLMDPADPGKFAPLKPYIFKGWDGAVKSKKRKIEVYVKGETEVIAKFGKD